MLATVASMSPRKPKTYGPTARQVAANVRRLRQRAGLTRKELATRTNGALTMDAVQKIENGAAPPEEERVVRNINADELTALAAALGVTPNALMLPPTTRGEAEVTGVGEISARDAWRWARGRNRLPQDRGPMYVSGGEDEEDAALSGIEWEKDMQFRRENARDDPPAILPSGMTTEQMNADAAVVDAVLAAQRAGLRPKAVTNHAREVALAHGRKEEEQRREEERRAAMTPEDRELEDHTREEQRQEAKAAAHQILAEDPPADDGRSYQPGPEPLANPDENGEGEG